MGNSHARILGVHWPFSGKPSKPVEWLELWAVGIYDLHLPEGQFWNLTLAQFVALTKRHLLEQRRLDARAALICAVLANIHRNPQKHRAFTIEDFMPSDEKKPLQRQTSDEMLENIQKWNILLGGKETRRQ